MSWRTSALGKVLASILANGVRAGLRDAAGRWLRRKLSVPYDVVHDYEWVLTGNRPASRPRPHQGPLKINWLIPSFGEQGGGGHFNIFRVIHHFEDWGHEQYVYIVGETALTEDLATESARKNYFPISSRVKIFTGEVAESDALVATSWRTAYAARGLGNTARKFYFVQDLEHLFYPEGSLSELARQTYRWGFHGIVAGEWIAETLRRQFNMECSSFGFSYDQGTYSPTGERRFSETKKRVLFYARPTTERRGFELGILALSLVARQMPDIEFILVGFPSRSIRLPFPAVFPGVLATVELAKLYRSCTVALVLSHTNLSLLPLELMACGCPVVSNSGPNVEWLLTQDSAELADPTPEALANAIVSLLTDDRRRACKAAAGLALAQSTSWTSEIRTIESALFRGLNPTAPIEQYA